MRVPTLTLAAALLFAGSIFAQDTPAPHQDYSRDALLRFVASNDIKMSPLPEHLKGGRIQWHLGWMEFRGLGMEWRIVYLPTFDAELWVINLVLKLMIENTETFEKHRVKMVEVLSDSQASTASCCWLRLAFSRARCRQLSTDESVSGSAM